MRDRQTDRKKDGQSQMEREGIGRRVNKTSPRIHHYLAMDIEYQMGDRRRLHISLLLLKMTNIFWREKDRERKRDGWDMESDGDWHSIFLNSNPISLLSFLMANQLCRSAETNHHIAESITVTHGNTSPQLSVFIKPGRFSALTERGGDTGNVWYALSQLSEVARDGCNLDSDKKGTAECYRTHALTSGEAKHDQSKDGWWSMADRCACSNVGQVLKQLKVYLHILLPILPFSLSATRTVYANIKEPHLTLQTHSSDFNSKFCV